VIIVLEICLLTYFTDCCWSTVLFVLLAGTLKLDISPCPSEMKNCLTSELYKVDPYPDNRIRPVKEIVEFAVRDILEPYTTYRSCTFVHQMIIICLSFKTCSHRTN